MSEPVADPADVRDRLNLPSPDEAESGISEEAIQKWLEDSAFENAEANNVGRMSDEKRRQIEWRLAGIKILSHHKGLRAYHQQSLGSMSRSYETRSTDELKNELDRIDPSGKLAHDAKRPARIDVPEVK